MLMNKYRADGTAYHSQSRGTPRWSVNSAFVAIGITIALFLFDLPAGILFVMSCVASTKLASEQEAAIYNQLVARYGQSEISKQMELKDKSTSFRIIEAAVTPEFPASPNRPAIVMILSFICSLLCILSSAIVDASGVLRTASGRMDSLRNRG